MSESGAKQCSLALYWDLFNEAFGRCTFELNGFFRILKNIHRLVLPEESYKILYIAKCTLIVCLK